MERHLLITGMGGVIGSKLAEVAVGQGFKVFGTIRNSVLPSIANLAEQGKITAFRVDLRERPTTEALISLIRPDTIVNLAGYPHSDPVLGRAVSYENMAILNNLVFSVLSLQRGRNRFLEPVTFVQAGTIWQYGQNLGEIPLTEIPYYEMPHQPANFYTQSKIEAEELLQTLHQGGFGIHPILLRFAHHIGEGKTDGLAAIAAEEVLRAKRAKSDCIRIKNKAGRIDLSDAYDGARAIVSLIHFGVPGEAYNIARGEQTTVEEILLIMSQKADLPSSVDVVSTGEEVQTHARFNISKLLSTGFKPLYSLSDTVERFFDWYYQKDLSNRKLDIQHESRKAAFV